MNLSVNRFVWRRVLPPVSLIVIALVGWRYFQRESPVREPSAEVLDHLSSLLEEDDPPYAWMTISKETTYVTQPLDKYGRVDYFAAYNAVASENVSVDNNAAVRFVKAGFGLSNFSEDDRQLYFKLLGIEPVQEEGPYFRDLILSNEIERKDFDQAMTEPWSAATFPKFQAWLNENQVPLELVVEGTGCPYCYAPWIPGPDSKSLLNARLPVAQLCRSFARALVLRAMLRLNEGRIPDAQQDLLACHRLGRLIGTTHGLIVSLVCFEIDRRAWNGDAALLRFGKLSTSDALGYRELIRQMAQLPDVIDEVDYVQRLMLLDSVSSWRLKRYAFSEETDVELEPHQISRLKEMYDEIMRVCNQGKDRYVAAGRLPTYSERVRETEHETASLRSFLAPIAGVSDQSDPRMVAFFAEKAKALQGASPREVGQEVGRIYFSLLMPMVPLEAEAQARTRAEIGEMGFALAAYNADHADYPQSLDALVTNYISQLPTDHFDKQPLRYIRRTHGYVLYSFGANGRDDDRRTRDSQPPGDDIVMDIQDPEKGSH